MAQVVGRFAPTPSGYLHLGNLFCSLIAWLAAKSQGGTIILRNEDLDVDRSRQEYFVQAQRDLESLGLYWDEGGETSGPHGPYDQSKRSDFYTVQLQKLETLGLVYPCFCTRALRLQVPDQSVAFTDLHYGPQEQYLPTGSGDFILRRSDGVFAYQLAVVADDGAMGVTQVVRGRDLLSSTPKQILLYRLLGYPVPEFGHTPLVLAHDGRRLSKRDGDQSLTGLTARGFSPADVVGALAYLGGLLPEPMAITPQELLPLFAWSKLPREDIRIPQTLFEKHRFQGIS